ncbi:MAG: YkgJ family cysteine cluster protein [Thermodesulfobacteriota bacterium]|nr:YkgJ family cysteine cluster protein [Thermodesulfobacteriota bacterium]
MTWHERLEDFGEEIEPGSKFHFECHPGLKCFGTCCATDVTLTPFDIARMRRHMGIDTHRFLADYCQPFVEAITGFPSVILKHGQDGRCILLNSRGCSLYESRPSCCRYYPLARVIGNDGGSRSATYYLQRRVDYCNGLGRGPKWTTEAFCEQNGLGPYEKANDIFLQIPFAFDKIPFNLRHDKEVQTMVYRAVFDFDRFFEEYARFGQAVPKADDHEMVAMLTNIVLKLLERTAELAFKQ